MKLYNLHRNVVKHSHHKYIVVGHINLICINDKKRRYSQLTICGQQFVQAGTIYYLADALTSRITFNKCFPRRSR